MQTAIAYSRILRQMAERQREQDRIRAEQRLHGVAARIGTPADGNASHARQPSAQH